MADQVTSSRTRHGRDPGPTSRRERLTEARIIEGIRPAIRPHIRRIDILDQTDSTNDELLRLPAGTIHGRVVLAERQTAGKGRRGRRWQSPAGNIFLSIGWRFGAPPRSVDGLPLVVGVCMCRALARIGVEGQRVKRPNDILVDGAKLCGILVETRGGRSDRDTVTGIGLNVRLDDDSGDMIDQRWTDLQQLLGDELPSRNEMVSIVLEELLPRFHDEQGLNAFLAAAWPEWDLCGGNP